jgi:hypothetical protein
VLLKNGMMHRFLGFPSDAYTVVSKSLGEVGHELVKREFAPKGRNWGDLSFKGNSARSTASAGTASHSSHSSNTSHVQVKTLFSFP